MSTTPDAEDKIIGVAIFVGIAVMSLFCGAGILAAVVMADCATIKEFRYESAFLKRPVSIECKPSGETLKLEVK